MKKLTVNRLREIVAYNADTGVFVRLVTASHNAKAGDIAGSPNNSGYLKMNIDNKSYLLHRLAWLHVHEIWPKHQIDHINGMRKDNRICNLRDVKSGINSQNRKTARTDNKLGMLGVCDNGYGRYLSQIQTNGRKERLGSFDTPEQAHQIYLETKRQLHEGCTI